MLKSYNGDFNSPRNQRIKEDFVRREVRAWVTPEVDYILNHCYGDSAAPYSWDDVEHYSIDNSEEIAELSEKIEELEAQLEELQENKKDSPTIEKLKKQIKELEERKTELEEETPAEVCEWWLVSGWLGNKLKEKGQYILERWGASIWGRRTSGQAIYLDEVISRICCDLEILEGQPLENYNWIWWD